MLNHPKIIYKVRDIRDRTIQYLVGAGSPKSLRLIEQSQKPALSLAEIYIHILPINSRYICLVGGVGAGLGNC